MPARPANWEEQFLRHGLSERAKRAGVAYAGPGSGNDIPLNDRPPIAFTGGIPDPISLPIEELAAASDTVLRRDGEAALQYGGVQGFVGLREWLAGHWTQIDATALTPENFSLTIGSAHALENVCQTFVDKRDVVLVEAPSFPGSIRVIHSLGCAVDSVPVDADGLNVAALEETLRHLESRDRRVKLLYTIPNYQNPTGTTLSLARRHRLIELCEQYDVLIVEDDAYGEICFDDSLPPSLYALARGRGVVKLGTFSKIIAPGLRAGWIQAPAPIVGATLATRFDMGLSPLLLRMIAEYAGGGRLETQIAALRQLYRRKRDLMVQALSERCSDLMTWSEPAGGFFLWLQLHKNVDAARLRLYGAEEGVLFGSGPGFFADPESGLDGVDSSRFVRLAFSYTAAEQIAEGVRRLGRALERAAE